MKLRFSLVWVLFACADALAAQDPPKFTPEVRGQLTTGKQPLAANVCLRHAGSEIRACGYTDFSGYFLIPASGPIYPVRNPDAASAPAATTPDYPVYWLELGVFGDKVTRLSPVDLFADKKAKMHLDCDFSRDAISGGDASTYCRSDGKSLASVATRK